MKETKLAKERREKAEKLYPIARSLLERRFSSSSLTLDFYSDTVPAYALAGVSGLTSITIPTASVIETHAFDNLPDLENLYAPKVTHINSYAIQSCPALKSVSFPEVETVDNLALNGLSSISYICFPKVTEIGYITPIGGCPNLKTIELPELSILSGPSILFNCSNIENIIAPNLATATYTLVDLPSTIDFNNYPKLKSLYGISNYKGSSFVISRSFEWSINTIHDCPNLEIIDCPTAVSSIYLYNLPKIKSINLPLVDRLSNSAVFSNFYNLESLTLSSNVSLSIGSYAFYNCQKLSEICFANASWLLTTYSSYAFYSMSSITRFILPNTFISSLYSSTLYNLKYDRPLSYIQLGSLSYIYSYALASFNNLETFAVSHVHIIYSYAFTNCPKLTTLMFGNINHIYSYAFSGVSTLRSLYILNDTMLPGLSSSNTFMTTLFTTPYDQSRSLYASVYVRMSMLSRIAANYNWIQTIPIDRFVGLRDSEVSSVLNRFGWDDNRSWISTVSV